MAEREFREALRGVVSRVTGAALIAGTRQPRGGELAARFPGSGIAPLKGPYDLGVKVSHDYRVTSVDGQRDRWEAYTMGYIYELLTRAQTRVIAYHWHPVGRSRVTWPHAHIGGETRPIDLSGMHLPTRVIPLAWVLLQAIEEFAVDPLLEDWRAVLGTSGRVIERDDIPSTRRR